MDYFELLRYRKSTRKFTNEQVSQENLSSIIAAANSSPIGSNLYRDVHLTVVHNRDVLNKLSEATVKRWEDKVKMKKIIGDTMNIELSEIAGDPFYGAPVVIFVSHRKQDLQPGLEFSNVACITYSMHLAATSLGLGSVFMWGSLESMREIPELDNTAVLNLPEGFEPLLGIAVGHPATELTARDIKTDKISINYL